ncbi:hypothetical protein MKW98_020878 [Papaver atlanticum]|uniref:Uncharacterized protein n=1 Tax=Papaver atlanticum TaxID=357466 RepID=A0AAD4XWZ4_9MAGN|nr:hypothetical protein MKW98_020878 [Papaver atlanticum]
MVDAVLLFAVEKLGDALTGETFFLLGIRNQVKGLRDELIRMQCFLQDADAKEQQGDDRVRNWVKEIRDVAYDAEDVIDTFLLKIDSNRKTKGIKNFLTRKALMVKNLGHLHRVGNEILAIQARLKAISDSRITYGIKDLQGNEASSFENRKMIQHPQRNRYPHFEDNDVIGFGEHTKTLLIELMKDEERRRVISIIGVGGLGKTTLTKNLYRHQTVKSRFDCCGWGSVSQQLNTKDVLGEILKCMSLPIDELQMDEGDLMEKLYNHLQDKRYFVVLDDVWKVNHWNTLSPAFPTGKRGSKILLTTRNKEVALHADPWSLHFEPQFLNDDDSWELLCKKAFPKEKSDAHGYPTGLEKLGREMVRKCGGLPLGICEQWELVHKDVISYINRGEDGGVNAILALSYHDLPSHLKPCFLYLGLFPKDYAIPRKKLIQLWVAEGFISHTEENILVTMEDIGKNQYLAELTQRCMIQLGNEFILEESEFGSICRVHDLMRDLCLSKAKEINFLNIFNPQHRTAGDVRISHPVITDSCRRVRRYPTYFNGNNDSDRYDISFNKSDCTIRTLIVAASSYKWGFCIEPINYQNIKLLRVLDLGDVKKHKTGLTKAVSKLIHLRYLSLGYLSGISSSIGNLQNLQTLKLYGYKGSLPETTSKLVQLRHLDLGCGSLDQKFRIKNLTNLQTIDSILAGEWIRKGCFEKLSNLRKLSVWDTSRLQTDIIVDEVVRKRSSLSSFSSSSDDQYQNPIRSLLIYTKEEIPNSIFDSLSCCRNLHTLDLTGRVEIVSLQKYPPNLTKLSLSRSFFMEDPMATLQYLPKLRNLKLDWCEYEGEKMVCSSQGFPQLQYLSLQLIKNVKEWRIDQGLRFITTLKELKIEFMSWVTKRVVEGVGEDWYKVQYTLDRHISTYIIFILLTIRNFFKGHAYTIFRLFL